MVQLVGPGPGRCRAEDVHIYFLLARSPCRPAGCIGRSSRRMVAGGHRPLDLITHAVGPLGGDDRNARRPGRWLPHRSGRLRQHAVTCPRLPGLHGQPRASNVPSNRRTHQPRGQPTRAGGIRARRGTAFRDTALRGRAASAVLGPARPWAREPSTARTVGGATSSRNGKVRVSKLRSMPSWSASPPL